MLGGFGHIAFNCDDVYAATEILLANGVKAQPLPSNDTHPLRAPQPPFTLPLSLVSLNLLTWFAHIWAHLVAHSWQFHKKPDEGRMKGLAFALDPDGCSLRLPTCM